MKTRTFYRGTIDYLRVEIEDTEDPTGVVEFSYDRTTWYAATWEAASTTRTPELLSGVTGTVYVRVARLLLDLTLAATPPTTDGPVFVRLTDTPERPVFNVGLIAVR